MTAYSSDIVLRCDIHQENYLCDSLEIVFIDDSNIKTHGIFTKLACLKTHI